MKVFSWSLEKNLWLIAFVETQDEIFLKTIIPSRKATRQYPGESL